MNIIAIIEKLNAKRQEIASATLPPSVAHLKVPGLQALSGYIRTLIGIARKQWLDGVDLPEITTDLLAWHNVECSARENGASDYDVTHVATIRQAVYWIAAH
jgi:hypothetical protein